MLNISKSFPGVRALDRVCLTAGEGEIHALVGENGAGKSTLIKVLTGVLKRDEGEIYINGKSVEIKNPKVASEYGISTIFQEFSLVDYLNVAENIFLGKEFTSFRFFLNKNRIIKESEEILNRLGFYIPPRKLVGELSVSEKQVVEIAKALSANAKIFVMDEPTSSLTEKEKDILFEIMEKLKERGSLVIFISHKLDEITKVSDRLTILRDGKNVGEFNIKDITSDRIISLMTGSKATREVVLDYDSKGEVILKIKNFSKKKILKDISFELYKGEILGVPGLVGSGKSELARAILGLDPQDSGEVYLDDKKINISSIGRALGAGFGYVSEDRRRDTLFPELTVRENITISSLDNFCRFSFILKNKEREKISLLFNKLKIKAASHEQKVMYLSGGNQQKVAISRCLLLNPRILILDEPTTGVDVGVKAEIYNIIKDLANGGIGVIFISSDFEEIFKLSSRIMVMKNGEIKGIFLNRNIDKGKILSLAMN